MTTTPSTGTPSTAPGAPALRLRPRRVPTPLRWAVTAIAATTLTAIVVLSVISITGIARIVWVGSGSMEPTIAESSLVWLEPIPVADVEVGTVVAFHAPTDDRPLTIHRVIEISECTEGTCWRTAGDGNGGDADPWLVYFRDDTAWEATGSIDIPGWLLSLYTGWTRFAIVFAALAVALFAGLTWIWRPRPVVVPLDELDDDDVDAAATEHRLVNLTEIPEPTTGARRGWFSPPPQRPPTPSVGAT